MPTKCEACERSMRVDKNGLCKDCRFISNRDTHARVRKVLATIK